MSYTSIIFERLENIAKITLNRPDKLNALNRQVFEDLEEAISEIELDSSIKAVILTGAGEKAFAAGADISELNECDQYSGKLFSEFGSKIMQRLENLRIPVVAAVNGFALGGGCELTLACHIRFASTNAKFGQPEVNLGILPGYGGTQRLTKIVGRGKAIEMICSGNNINAEEAYRIGLVNGVYEQTELMSKVMEFVNVILSKGQLAVSASIDSIIMSESLSISDGLLYESRKFGEVCGSEDFKEGTTAFLEKRKAEFIGK